MDARLPRPVPEQKKRRGGPHALDSVLPFDGRDFLAEILTDDDVAALRHLGNEDTGETSLNALASDVGLSRSVVARPS
ncbi:MAG: hypothetical protein EOQ55_03435 [Mesorhizobium sp.]|uniref:hypothetical protein n=1 Tax=Mesorhizobium sp. TaxID=1871066 RepID=UPI000FEA3B3B|nr:hypothetical protein [Mesorhizobium sp.]RWG22583.1 MAG: hypothetical protein EOQ55_03435 [Mesorhizobium sp.]